ncbi:unnamed protein product, partial [Vitis vinifera]
MCFYHTFTETNLVSSHNRRGQSTMAGPYHFGF